MGLDDETANKIDKTKMKENLKNMRNRNIDWSAQEAEKERAGGSIKEKLEL